MEGDDRIQCSYCIRACARLSSLMISRPTGAFCQTLFSPGHSGNFCASQGHPIKYPIIISSHI